MSVSPYLSTGYMYIGFCGSLVFDSLVSGNLKWGGTFVGGELGTCS